MTTQNDPSSNRRPPSDAEDWENAPEIDAEKMKNKRKRKKSTKVRLDANLYEALGFDEWGEDFTTKKLKKKYMKLALKHHPDKLGDKYDEIAKKKWLTVRDTFFLYRNLINLKWLIS